MEKHITLVGVLNIVYHAISLLGAMLLVVVGLAFNGIFESLVLSGHIRPVEVPMTVIHLVPLLLFLIAACLGVLSVAGIIGAVGVLKKMEWGRLTVLVVSFFGLARVPLGTILGIYSIWALLNADAIKLFAPENAAPAGNVRQ